MPEELVPKVGMFFDSEEEAYELFRKYAEKAGFPIKWDTAKALCVTYPVQCQVIGPTSSLASNESVTSLARRLGARFT